jgi:hypothetical protein
MYRYVLRSGFNACILKNVRPNLNRGEMLDDDGIQITPQYHNFKPDLWAQRTL